MNKTLDLVAISPWLAPSLQAEQGLKRVPAAEAKKHVGQSVVVFGKVVQIVALEKVSYLNLDKPHPESPFTAVVFTKTVVFGDLASLEGKTVEVTGKVIEFHERAEIVIQSKDQLKVL